MCVCIIFKNLQHQNTGVKKCTCSLHYLSLEIYKLHHIQISFRTSIVKINACNKAIQVFAISIYQMEINLAKMELLPYFSLKQTNKSQRKYLKTKENYKESIDSGKKVMLKLTDIKIMSVPGVVIFFSHKNNSDILLIWGINHVLVTRQFPKHLLYHQEISISKICYQTIFSQWCPYCMEGRITTEFEPKSTLHLSIL